MIKVGNTVGALFDYKCPKCGKKSKICEYGGSGWKFNSSNFGVWMCRRRWRVKITSIDWPENDNAAYFAESGAACCSDVGDRFLRLEPYLILMIFFLYYYNNMLI